MLNLQVRRYNSKALRRVAIMKNKVRIFALIPVMLACLCLLPEFAGADADSARGVDMLPGFTLHKLGTGEGPTLLVIGGIQGDEPGGFSGASLMATQYNILKGSVWVVPNLNFPSIIYSSRGLHGDMNRKFAAISEKDPEYETIRRIQSIILAPEVDVVVNMHDGSGFYRPKWEDRLHNPQRWGQCIVIDQAQVDDEVVQNSGFQDLSELARRVAARVNVRLLLPLHVYNIKNTTTRNFDREMEKTLSYFAVLNGKSGFGIEASKELPTEQRIYYHGALLEGFMREMGIEFERKFELSPQGVMLALNSNVSVHLYNNRTVFNLTDARSTTRGYIPVRKGVAVETSPSNPLLAVLPGNQKWRVVYGNRTLTSFTPEYLEFDDSVEKVELMVDGKSMNARIGEMIKVDKNFAVGKRAGYRVNAIGARQEVDGCESGVLLLREHFEAPFSLDKSGNVFRVEFYRDKSYCGMILINFGPETAPVLTNTPLTATLPALNSDLGR